MSTTTPRHHGVVVSEEVQRLLPNGRVTSARGQGSFGFDSCKMTEDRPLSRVII